MAITKLNNKAVANITTLPVALGDMVFISSATASSSASIEFTLGNYKEYQFFFVNIHPANNRPGFEFNISTDGGANYNVTKTTTFFRASHGEGDQSPTLSYVTGDDQAQQTGNTRISPSVSNQNDSGLSGYLHLFNPSSTTFVKHFISCNNVMYEDPSAVRYSWQSFVAGYGNTTSAINSVKFNYASGNIDSGKILMFGIN